LWSSSHERSHGTSSRLSLFDHVAISVKPGDSSSICRGSATFGIASRVTSAFSSAWDSLPAMRRAFRLALHSTQREHLNLFLSFVRTAHYWTKLHPQLSLEDDIVQLLNAHEVLAARI